MLGSVIVLLAVLVPHPAVYVKGHSRAAAKTREDLQTRTCYSLARSPEKSDAVLEVDHLFDRSGDQSVVMVLVDSKGKVVWESKTAIDPIPLRSPVNRLLKRLARSTCSAPDLLAAAGQRAEPAR
ncbi:MAG TPA: hypothetical protein VGZ29_13060 [Terriglobia bacterium]|nr:hypothetical protein [Terriglobia bacterium]